MTAFSPAQLPANVNTVEKLYSWCVAILQELNYDTLITEDAGSRPQAVATQTIFNVRTEDYDGLRSISRASLPIASNYAATGKWYLSTLEINTATIPAPYTVA